MYDSNNPINIEAKEPKGTRHFAAHDKHFHFHSVVDLHIQLLHESPHVQRQNMNT